MFRLLIIDAAAFMAWPYMGFGEYMEVYSGYDPAWRFAHCPDYWIKEHPASSSCVILPE